MLYGASICYGPNQSVILDGYLYADFQNLDVRSALLLTMDILWEILYFDCRSRASCRSIIATLSCSLLLYHRDALVLAVEWEQRTMLICFLIYSIVVQHLYRHRGGDYYYTYY